jgi:hypothetical protein
MSVSANPNYGVTAVTAETGAVTLTNGFAFSASLELVSDDQEAGFRWQADGFARRLQYGTWSLFASSTDWIRPDTLAPSDYYIRITNVIWSSPITGFFSAAAIEDTWIDLTSTRAWTVKDTNVGGLGYKDVDFTVEIKKGIAGPTVATGLYGAYSEWEGTCFGPDTIVLMEDNSEKLMRDLDVGDVLRSYSVPNRIDESDPEWVNWKEPEVDSGTMTTSKVASLNSFDQGACFLINNELKVTAAHHLLVYRESIANWMWVRPHEISVGDLFYNSDKVEIPVASIEFIRGAITVYNVDVEDIDSFYVKVNDEFIVVHNKIAP